jgi:hypothetical protein
MDKNLEILLASLLYKVNTIYEIYRDKKKYSIENLELLSLEIDFIDIKEKINNFPYDTTNEVLDDIKTKLFFLYKTEVVQEILVHSIFIIKDAIDYKEAKKILLDEFHELISQVDKLLMHIKVAISQDGLLNTKLKLDFFRNVLTWTDTDKRQLLSVQGSKSEDSIAIQFYDIYMGKEPKTKYTLNFLWSKEAIYYLLKQIASTNKTLIKKSFYENPLFTINGDSIKDSSVRPGASKFEKDNSRLKTFIDSYFNGLD